MVLRSLLPLAKSSGIGSEKRMAHYPSTPILLCVGLMHLMLFLLWVALPQPNLSRPKTAGSIGSQNEQHKKIPYTSLIETKSHET